MMATLAFLSALSVVPAQEGQLRITNERLTYGVLGAARPNDKFLPGDAYFLTFDIENLKVGKDGKIKYKRSMEILDKDKKAQFKGEPEEAEVVSHLGGNKLPAFAHALLGTDMVPGEYTLLFKVEDSGNKKTTELTKTFTILPKAFGIVRVNTSYDMHGELQAPAVAVPGQSLWLTFGTVGFKRSPKNMQPNIAVEIRIVDENGKSTLEEPIIGGISENVPKDVSLIPMQNILSLNRAGKFTVKVTVTDKVAEKSESVEVPILVVDPKGK
jgi:hypothetical protein